MTPQSFYLSAGWLPWGKMTPQGFSEPYRGHWFPLHWVYNMTISAKHCHVIIHSANFYHTLVVCYHAHCSISYLASDVWIVISWDSGVIKCYRGHRRGWDTRGGTWEGNTSGRWEKGYKKRINGDGIFLRTLMACDRVSVHLQSLIPASFSH